MRFGRNAPIVRADAPRIVFRWVPPAIAIIALIGVAPGARAQTRWAVVSAASSSDDAGRAREVAEHAFAALTAQGETLVPQERAAARIGAELSGAFTPAPDDLPGRVARAADTVLADVVAGRSARARDQGEPILEAAEEHIVALGRLDVASRDIANLCLFLVRADLEDQLTDQARTRMQRCVTLVPTLQADERLHPPEIGALLEEIRPAHRRADNQGILSVQSAATDPEGCAIRVNGSRVGRTPWARVPLSAGSYLVQVECDPALPGRIFHAQVEAGDTTRLTINGRLSQSLVTTPGIALVYRDAAELAARIDADVAHLGRVLGVDRVLVGVVADAGVSVRAFEVVQGSALARLTGSAPVAEPIDDSTSSAAVQSARSGRRLAEPAGGAIAPPTTESSSGGGDTAVAVLGGSLLTIGVVGFGVGWYFWSEIDVRGQEFDRATTPGAIIDRQRAFDQAETPVLIAGAASGLLSGAGAALLASQSGEVVPWWSWVIGAAGLGVGAVGVYILTTEGTCYGNASVGTECDRRSPTMLLGTFVLEHAAPLLAVPITCWIRAAIGAGADSRVGAANIRLDSRGFDISWSGSF